MRFEEGYLLQIKSGEYNPNTGVVKSKVITSKKILAYLVKKINNEITIHVKGDTYSNMTHIKLKNDPTIYMIKNFNMHPIFKTKIYLTEIDNIEKELE